MSISDDFKKTFAGSDPAAFADLDSPVVDVSVTGADGVFKNGTKATVRPAAAFGSSTFTDPAGAYGARGTVTSSTMTKVYNYLAGVVGIYNIASTNASVLPKVGIMGAIADGTTSADAAVMAVLDGDTAVTTARAGFGITVLNSTAASGFTYGLDLLLQAVPGHASYTQAYKKAEVRLGSETAGSGLPVVFKVGAFTDNADVSTTFGDGSLFLDNTTGSGKVGIVTNGHVQTLALA